VNDLTAYDRVVILICTLDAARVEWDGRSGGDGVKLMPSAYHEGSYQELERCLLLMQTVRPSQWWHVLERYRWGQEQTLDVPVAIRRGGPQLRLPAHCELRSGQAVIGAKTARVRVYRWGAGVDAGKVRDGVRWLTRTMYGGRRSRIQLPDAEYRRAVGLEARDRRERPVATVAA
jgi:hypothetical protein